MKIASRLLLGTLATAAAVGGSAVSAHAAALSPSHGPGPGSGSGSGSGADDGASFDMDSMLCPVASSGVVGRVLNGLNKESIDRSCGGLHKSPAGSPLDLL